jgi:hypothetical protein
MAAKLSWFPRIALLLLAGTQWSAAWCASTARPSAPLQHGGSLSRATTGPDARVLQSTVEIVAVSNTASGTVGVMSLGALVYQNGWPKLYTHNHYDANPELPLADVVRVLFLNSAGEYLAQISGREFRLLLTGAQDPGTALVDAPFGLRPAALGQLQGVGLVPSYAQLGDPHGLARGSAVSVPLRGAPGAALRHEALPVLTAVVESTDQLGIGAVPMFRLRLTQLGVALVGGDSGGPIWFRGQVVGNTWSMTLDHAGQGTSAFWAAQAPHPGPAPADHATH